MNLEKHNGYANYDTWKVAVNIDNVLPLSRYVVKFRAVLLGMKRDRLIPTLKTLFVRFTQERNVNWNNVRVSEIKTVIRELEISQYA